MKKCHQIYLVILFSLLSPILSKAQNAYYDAITLRSLIVYDNTEVTDPNNPAIKIKVGYVFKGGTATDLIYEILIKYLDSFKVNNTLSRQYIRNAYKGNPFLEPLVGGLPQSVSSFTGTKSFLSALGGLDVTALADGLASFLVERTKQELNESFFRKLEEYLNRYPEIRILFPNTYVLITNFNSWEFSNYLNTLREAFDKDIKELLANLQKLADIKESDCKCDASSAKSEKEWCGSCKKKVGAMKAFFATNDGRYLLSALEIGNGLVHRKDVPEIVHTISSSKYLGGLSDQSDITNSIQLIDILSQSVRSNTTGYLPIDSLSNLFADSLTKMIYFGLIYEQIAQANHGSGIIIAKRPIIKDLSPSNINGFQNYLTTIIKSYRQFDQSLQQLKNDKQNAVQDLTSDYGLVFDNFKSFLDNIYMIQVINSNLRFSKETEEVWQYVDLSLQVAHDISVRNYNAAVVGTLNLITEAINKNSNSSEELKEFTSAFLKYGSLASNVVLSKDPQEVKQAIESFALPAGSASIKKHLQFTITLNAYVGLTYGLANPQKATYQKSNAAGGLDTGVLNVTKTVAIYAPVGFGFNFGLGWRKKNPWSISGFISLIDLGAIVGYRFLTDTGQLNTTFKVSLSNIFAPGANLIVGLPNMPLSIGGGIQWIPTIQRDASSNSFYNLDQSAFRYQVFIAMDIPMLNLHSSKKSFMYSKSIK
jgi:hypothetical protein